MTPPYVAPEVDLVRARAKLLASEDRRMRAELIRLREAAHLTQAEIGALIGVSQQAINKLERYDADPKLSTLRRYANAVGAIVEHHVSPDVGQSAVAATASPWESVGSVIPSSGFAADSKRTDFAIAA